MRTTQSASALKLMLVSLLTLLAAGCVGMSPAPTEESRQALQCAGWRPITFNDPEEVDALPDHLAVQIDGHMREGARKGCWRY